jgi:hypothetical protein
MLPQPQRYRRSPWRRPLTAAAVLALLLSGAGYAAYSAFHHVVTQVLTVPGCQAGSGVSALSLDFGQAADAATIAGVAAREHLPRQALTIAYATALQESKLENPGYGDLDSVGVFQQRPSQGWGTTTQLKDPAYAAAAFFRALVRVPGYTKMPIYQAAQAVQRSADGSAYQQYEQTGAALSAAFTTSPHAVTCWYDPASQAASEGVSQRPNLKAAARGLNATFGRPGQDGPLVRVATARSGKSATFHVTEARGWTVASWLVTHASSYGITQVSYRGFHWTARLTETGWQRKPGGSARSIVAS